jgi:hypothetical protein
MRVRAKNDDIRKILKHPIGGAFREDGTAEWPDDSYTFRRITDGDVTSEDVSTAASAAPAPAPEQKKSKKE